MIIGSGQLAKAFLNSDLNHENLCIFASGVSNSNCTDPKQFERERDLLIGALFENSDKKLIYFSSCALSAPEYPKNAYYQHKQYMENIVQEQSRDYLIFRIPQLFGKLKHHNTLINFLYKSILEGREFNVYSGAYRYVIEIDDVVTLVKAYIQYDYVKKILNLANPCRYSVLDIVKTFESLLKKKACYKLLDLHDGYQLNLCCENNFIASRKINVEFCEEYFLNKIRNKIK